MLLYATSGVLMPAGWDIKEKYIHRSKIRAADAESQQSSAAPKCLTWEEMLGAFTKFKVLFLHEASYKKAI